MTRRLLLVLTTVGAVLATTATASASNFHRNDENPSEVRRYWTAERMKNAIPVTRGNRGGGPQEHAKPSRPGGTSTSATSVEVPITQAGIESAFGKVFFSDGTYNYVCSGTALAGNVVWTAGHCVNEGPGRFYTKFVFVPGYRDGSAPWGRFPAPQLDTTDRWQTQGEFGVDVGAAIPEPNEAGQELVDVVNERPLAINSTRQQAYRAYGYPAEGKFNGQRLRVCNTAWSRNDTSTNPDTMGIPCDMNGGSSGGGWLIAGDAVASVNSYGYGSLKNVMFGPHLELEAQALYNDAKTTAAASG